MTKKSALLAPEKKTGKKKKTSPDYAQWARQIVKASWNETASKLPAGLYIVSTPIGNLGDISLRALETLTKADVIACEDTRVTGTLLHLYGIKKPLLSYYDHNADQRQPEILSRVKMGESVALVSDAGTPLVSDPGFKLVEACRAEDLFVTAIPGASAHLAALVTAGLPTDKVFFAGFLPPKNLARQKAISEYANVSATLVFYEASSRLCATLDDLAERLGATRPAVVARELTKLYEDIQAETLGNLAAYYRSHPTPKGEIVILVGPAQKIVSKAIDIDVLLKQKMKTMSLRDAVEFIVETTGAKKNDVYRHALKLK